MQTFAATKVLFIHSLPTLTIEISFLIRPLFLYFRSFHSVDSIKVVNRFKFCRCLHSNQGTSDLLPPIYWTLGNFLKPLATINLPESPTFLDNFCKCVKIYNFSSNIILGNFYSHLAIFFWSHWLQLSTILVVEIIC